jgi:hypothetical protein
VERGQEENVKEEGTEGERERRGKKENQDNKQEVLGRTKSRTFRISHLFEVLEPNLMELILNELTLTSFNSASLNLTEFTTINNLVGMVTTYINKNNLVAMVTIQHKQ